MHMSDSEAAAYFAGFFDGEGYLIVKADAVDAVLALVEEVAA